MSLKPKTSKRLLILAGILVAAAGGVGTLVLVRQHQRQAAITNARDEGMRLFGEKNYYLAMGALSKYLASNENDREATLAYAKCREMIEEPKGEHILQAITHYRRALAMDRTDAETSRHLLELMPLAGLNVETRELAMAMRPAALEECGVEHVEVLRAEANARIAASPADVQAEAILRRLLELAPGDLPARVVLVEHLRERKRVNDALAVASSVPDAATPDGAAKRRLLTALARRDEPAFDSNGEVFAALCDITGLDPRTAGPTRSVTLASPLEALRTAALFDSLGAYAHSLAVLLEGNRQFDDPVIDRIVARRTWTAGRAADTVAITNPADLTPAGTHSEILVYRALAHIDLGKLEDARAIADALARREGDFRAAAWTKALAARCTQPRLSPERALTVINEALQIAEDDAVLLLWQGEEHERLGRIDDARKAWEKSSRSSQATGWMTPALRRASLALSQNQPAAALRAAQEAFRIAPRSMGAFSALFRSHIAALESGVGDGNADPAQLLSTANRIDAELALATSAGDAQAFRGVMLPGRVILTTRLEGREAGKTLLNAVKQEPMANEPNALASLIEVSLAYNLDAEAGLLAALREKEAATPRTALLAALVAHKQGDADARKPLDDGLAAAAADEKLAWLRAKASFLDRTRSPDAAKAWLELADQFPDNVDAQLAALQSPAMTQRTADVAKLIERVAKLSNFSVDAAPPQLRLVRARSLLADPLTAANRRAALDLLRGLVVQEPDMYEARVSLALALMMDRADVGVSPIRGEAIQQVRALLSYAPDPDPWALELGRLYRAEGDVQAARGEFERLANTAKNPDVRLAAGETLLDLRAFSSAASAMERASVEFGDPHRSLSLVFQARAYHGLGRDDNAAALLRRVSPAGLTSGAQVAQLADALAVMGLDAPARDALTRLDAVEPSPALRLVLLARFENRHGSPDRAEALLRDAVSATPPSPEAWLALAAFLVEGGRGAEAKNVLQDAARAMPGETRIAAMGKQLELLSAKPLDEQDLQAMADLLEQSPQTRSRAQLVRTIEIARRDNQLRTPAQVSVVRDAVREDPVVLALLARVLLRAQPPNLNGAADVAATGVRLYPSSIDVLNASMDVARAQGDWSLLLESARSLAQVESSPAAVSAVAEAQVNLRQFDDAIKTLEPLMRDATAKPDEAINARVLGLFGGAHVLAGRAKAAYDTLAPLLSASPNLRNDFWLPAAGANVRDEREVRAWIGEAAKVSSSSSDRDQVAIASAYASAARRFPAASAEFLRSARAALEPLASGEQASPIVLEALANVLAQGGGVKEASDLLDRALKQGESASALRLASRLALQSDVERSVALAERAVKARNDAPSQQALGLALLARAQARVRAGDGRGAAEAGRLAGEAFAVVLDVMPTNFEARLGMIDALEAQNKVGDTIPHHDALLNLPELPLGVSRTALQNNAAYAIVRAGRTGMELERAKQLIESAIRAQPLGAFYDTLGAVERARKDRDAAIAAYRQGVALDPSMAGAWASLAELLSTGTVQEQEEARAAAKRALEIPGLGADQRARVEQLLRAK